MVQESTFFSGEILSKNEIQNEKKYLWGFQSPKIEKQLKFFFSRFLHLFLNG